MICKQYCRFVDSQIVLAGLKEYKQYSKYIDSETIYSRCVGY